MMKKERQTQRCVVSKISRAMPSIAPHIGVSVCGGAVTLSGHVDAHADRQLAETVALKCHGVHGLVNEIVVGAANPIVHDDESIASAVTSALAVESWELGQAIQVVVQNRWVTLHGVVRLQKSKMAAERVASRCPGVDGVTNDIAVTSRSRSTRRG